MKKLLLTFLTLSLLLTGCSSNSDSVNEDVTIDLQTLKSEVSDLVDPGFGEALEQFGAMYDATWVEQQLYMSEDLYEEIIVIGPNPMIGARGFEVIMVKAASGQETKVKEALDKRVEYGSGPNTEFYGSMTNYNEVLNKGAYFFLVVGEEKLKAPIEEAIK